MIFAVSIFVATTRNLSQKDIVIVSPEQRHKVTIPKKKQPQKSGGSPELTKKGAQL